MHNLHQCRKLIQIGAKKVLIVAWHKKAKNVPLDILMVTIEKIVLHICLTGERLFLVKKGHDLKYPENIKRDFTINFQTPIHIRMLPLAECLSNLSIIGWDPSN